MWITFWYHIILHLVYCRVLCTLPQTACEPRFTKCWPKINHVTSLWPDIMSWNIIITRRNRQPEQLSRRPFSVDNQGLGHVFLLFFILTVSWWVKSWLIRNIVIWWCHINDTLHIELGTRRRSKSDVRKIIMQFFWKIWSILWKRKSVIEWISWYVFGFFKKKIWYFTSMVKERCLLSSRLWRPWDKRWSLLERSDNDELFWFRRPANHP